MEDVILKVRGVEFRGWTAMSVSAGIQTLGRGFSVACSRLKDDRGTASIGIEPGDEVEVFLGSDVVVTGYVTKVSAGYDAGGIDIQVDGFSRTMMLKSALPYAAPRTFKDYAVTKLLTTLCGYFGVEVGALVNASTAETISFSADELVSDKIVQLVQRKSVLVTDDEAGRLVLLKAGSETANDAIETGKNVLSAKRTTDMRNRFREYVVYGQGVNADSTRPVTDNQVSAMVEDSSVAYRTNAVKQTGDAVASDCLVRASMLKKVAQAESDVFEYVLHGWRQSNGALWKPNLSVKVRDTIFNVDRRMVVTDVRYSMSASGTTVTLVLMDQDAFTFTGQSTTDEKVKTVESENSRLQSIGNLNEAGWTNT